MKKLLWIGDAAVASGFAKVTHKVLETLSKTWEVHVLALNYLGDPHDYPYKIYPCWPGGDAFGLGRVETLIHKVFPDVAIIQNDPWNIPGYMAKLPGRLPQVAVMPVDGKNCPAGSRINDLTLAVFWTQFGEKEAQEGGYTGPSAVIPLGVDLDIFKPLDRRESRVKMGLPKSMLDCFIVGNVNRNQPRKRLDLSVQYFAEWVKKYKVDDAYLFLYVAPTGDSGYNLAQLMHYYGFRERGKRLILVEPDITHGADEETLAGIYSAFDVQLSTTQGEGWGLTTLEGMACGIPQIVPRWSALGEWCEGSAMMVNCPNQMVTPNGINTIGGVPDCQETVAALHELYTNPATRVSVAERGRTLAEQPEYRWSDIGRRFSEALDQALAKEKVA